VAEVDRQGLGSRTRGALKKVQGVIMNQSPLFLGICDWLLDRALREGELTETVQDLGRKLVQGGLPVYRINVGGLLLHPALGALDITQRHLSQRSCPESRGEHARVPGCAILQSYLEQHSVRALQIG
jgi:hypothetical protein